MSNPPKKSLGRGLSNLIGGGVNKPEAPAAKPASAPAAAAHVAPVPPSLVISEIALGAIVPNARQPRRDFDDAAVKELSESIRSEGLMQPIVVRKVSTGYELIAGERRWRAAQKAGVHEVPVIIIEADDKQALEIAIIENVQRSDLNAIEEALSYEQLANEYTYSHSDIAKIIGKSRSYIANTMRLLKLPASIHQMLKEGLLSAGHARALLSVDDAESLAKRIVAEGLTVRDVERLASEAGKPAGTTKKSNEASKPKAPKDADTRALEKALNDVLGMNVSIAHEGESGSVTIFYSSLEQLDALCQRLKS